MKWLYGANKKTTVSRMTEVLAKLPPSPTPPLGWQGPYWELQRREDGGVPRTPVWPVDDLVGWIDSELRTIEFAEMADPNLRNRLSDGRRLHNAGVLIAHLGLKEMPEPPPLPYAKKKEVEYLLALKRRLAVSPTAQSADHDATGTGRAKARVDMRRKSTVPAAKPARRREQISKFSRAERRRTKEMPSAAQTTHSQTQPERVRPLTVTDEFTENALNQFGTRFGFRIPGPAKECAGEVRQFADELHSRLGASADKRADRIKKIPKQLAVRKLSSKIRKNAGKGRTIKDISHEVTEEYDRKPDSLLRAERRFRRGK
jgi:hypothetical protein